MFRTFCIGVFDNLKIAEIYFQRCIDIVLWPKKD